MNFGPPALLRPSSFRIRNFLSGLRRQKPLSGTGIPIFPLKHIHLIPLEADFQWYAHLVRECTSLKAFQSGILVHDRIVRAGFEKNVYLANLLMNMYAHFDASLPTAYWLFKTILHTDLFSWNFIIRAYQHFGLYVESLGLFQQMLGQAEVLPDQHIYVSVVSVCANVNFIEQGKQLHAQIIWNGFEIEIVVATSLVKMYAKCGSWGDVWLMFDRMPLRDIIAWSTLITACVQHCYDQLAIQLWKQLQEEGFLPNREIILLLIDACSSVTALNEGKCIHASFASTNSCEDSTIQKHLSRMYIHCISKNSKPLLVPFSCECKGLAEAKTLSKGEPVHQDLTTFSNQLLGQAKFQSNESLQGHLKKYSQDGLIEDALQTLKMMHLRKIAPEGPSLVTLISACANQGAIVEGEKVYALILETNIEVDCYLSTALLRLFGRGKMLEVAIALFDKVSIPDVVSWTAMIGACLENGKAQEALMLYKQMNISGIQPNVVTFISVLEACILTDSLNEAQQVHQQIIDIKADQNLFLGTALVNMYGWFGHLGDAIIVFDRLRCCDVIAWNALISAAANNKTSLQLCKQMLEEGFLQNKVTVIAILNACAFYSCLVEGKQIHTQALALGFESDLAVGTGLIVMYGRCDCLGQARFIYDMVSKKDSVFYTAMLATYAHHDMIEEAFVVFDEMLSAGIEPDNISCISILSACASKTGLSDGRKMHMRSVFCGLDQDGRVISGLINMYGKHCSLLDAIRTLEVASMKGKDMYVSALSACASQPDLVQGRNVHMHVVENGLELEVSVGNALVNMYSKCGILEEAQAMFEKLPQKDVVSWTVMITSYAQHGQADYALELFDLMKLKGIHPNKVTFTNILNAFTHSGMIEEGFQCFSHVYQEQNSIEQLVEHYNVMVDLLGKAGRLNEAEDLIRKMPFTATACTWTSMLDACRNHLDSVRGERVAENVFRTRPGDRTPHIMMQKMYAVVNRLETKHS